MPDDDPTSYDRGVEAGKVLSRLDAHDAHFTRINGSIDKGAAENQKVAEELHRLVLAVQHLEDQLAARDATVAGTTKRWSLWQFGVGVLLTFVVLAVLWWLFRALP
jgi:hypothetical protein